MKRKRIVSLMLVCAIFLTSTISAYAQILSDPNNIILTKNAEIKEEAEQNYENARAENQKLYDEYTQYYGGSKTIEYMCAEMGVSYEEYLNPVDESIKKVLDAYNSSFGEELYPNLFTREDFEKARPHISAIIDAETRYWYKHTGKEETEVRQRLVEMYSVNSYNYCLALMYSTKLYATFCETEEKDIDAIVEKYIDLYFSKNYTTSDSLYELKNNFQKEFLALNDGYTEEEVGDVFDLTPEEVDKYFKYNEFIKLAYLGEKNEKINAIEQELQNFCVYFDEELPRLTNELYSDEIERLNALIEESLQKIDEARNICNFDENEIKDYMSQEYGEYLSPFPNFFKYNKKRMCHGEVIDYNPKTKEITFDWQYDNTTDTLTLNGADENKLQFNNEWGDYFSNLLTERKYILDYRAGGENLAYNDMNVRARQNGDTRAISVSNIVVNGDCDLSSCSICNDASINITGNGTLKVETILSNENINIENANVIVTDERENFTYNGAYEKVGQGIQAKNFLTIKNSTVNLKTLLCADTIYLENANVNIKSEKENLINIDTILLKTVNSTIDINSASYNACIISNLDLNSTVFNVTFNDKYRELYENAYKYITAILISSRQHCNEVLNFCIPNTTFGIDDKDEYIYNNSILNIKGYKTGIEVYTKDNVERHEDNRHIIFEDSDINIDASTFGALFYSSDIDFINCNLNIKAKSGLKTDAVKSTVHNLTISKNTWGLLDANDKVMTDAEFVKSFVEDIKEKVPLIANKIDNHEKFIYDDCEMQYIDDKLLMTFTTVNNGNLNFVNSNATITGMNEGLTVLGNAFNSGRVNIPFALFADDLSSTSTELKENVKYNGSSIINGAMNYQEVPVDVGSFDGGLYTAFFESTDNDHKIIVIRRNYTVSYDTNVDNLLVDDYMSYDGALVTDTMLQKINREQFDFIGWFYDKDLTMPVNVNDTIKSNVTFYAKWKPIIDVKPNVIVKEETPLAPVAEPIKKEIEKIVNTNDSSLTSLWLVIGGLSVTGLIFITKKK